MKGKEVHARIEEGGRLARARECSEKCRKGPARNVYIKGDVKLCPHGKIFEFDETDAFNTWWYQIEFIEYPSRWLRAKRALRSAAKARS